MKNNISHYDYRAQLPDSYLSLYLWETVEQELRWVTAQDTTDIHLLLSATDNTELGRLLKTCKAYISITPSVLMAILKPSGFEKGVVTINRIKRK